MSLKKFLIEELSGLIPEDLLRLIPSRFPILGDVVLIRLGQNLLRYGSLIGQKILSYLDRIKGVWAIVSTERVIRQPKTIWLAGDRCPIVRHKELGTYFMFDVSRITFSPGNMGERKKLIEIVGDGESVLDMFACVGNLSLPLAINRELELIYFLEINHYAYKFLIHNIVMNKVQSKAIPLPINNLYFREENVVDHVLMGYLPCPSLEQVMVAIRACKQEGMIHIHTLARKGLEHEKCVEYVDFIKNQGVKIIDYTWEIVKSYSPTRNHIVARIQIEKKN